MDLSVIVFIKPAASGDSYGWPTFFKIRQQVISKTFTNKAGNHFFLPSATNTTRFS
jgi:hypothetical protein